MSRHRRALLPPPVARARATVLAVEAATVGLGAGIALALGLAVLLRPAAAIQLARPVTILAAAVTGLGAAGALLAQKLRLGERVSAEPTPPALRATTPFAVAGFALAACLARAASESGGDALGLAEARFAILLGLPFAGAVLATVAWRGMGAIGHTATPLAELLQPSAVALLSGFGVVLLVGLVAGSMSAELTYELGAGTTMAALWAAATTGRVLRGIRLGLRRHQADGISQPPVERALRHAALATLLGVLVPALVIAANLATAHLNGVVLAGAALVVVGHPLRYALALGRLESAVFEEGTAHRVESGG